MEAHKPKHVKNHNLDLLRQLFSQGASYSSKELSDQTGLSVVSINKLLNELITKGEILANDEAVVTGGRRAAVYKYNSNFKQMMILQFIESEEVIIGRLFISNIFGEIISERKLTAQELVFEALKKVIHEVLEEFPTVCLLVFGIPGVGLDGRLQIMDFEPLYNLNFRQLIQDEFSLEVIIENDINAATLNNSLKENDSGIFVSIYYPENYPPGAGIVINRKIFHGRHGLSGEIKHLPLENQEIFPKNEAVLEKQIKEVLQTVISMYDPTQIVLYSNYFVFSEEKLEEIRADLRTIFPYFDLPAISLKDTFQKDYFTGLIHLGFEQLMTIPV